MNGLSHGDIHPSALVSENASVGSNVTIGANAIVFDNVQLGMNSVIGANCILGEPTNDFYGSRDYRNPPLTIGEDALIRSGTILYAGSRIGRGFESGHRVTVREGAAIGEGCRVGTASDIQGDCRLGDYVRIHSNVFVAKGSQIRNFVWILPHSVLTNDPRPPSDVVAGVTVDEFAVLAAMVVVLPGVTIGRDALVGAQSLVRTDVPSEALVVGSPAVQIGTVRDLTGVTPSEPNRPAYPWRDHFTRGMPWEHIGYEVWAAGRLGPQSND